MINTITVMKKLSLFFLLLVGLFSSAHAEKKNIHIIRGKSTHEPYSHNNDEVGLLIQSVLEKSKYGKNLNITSSFNYPEDRSLIENADLVIISSDGGPSHALADKKDPTKYTKHLDSVIKKNKTGLIMIHWATDAPSGGFAQLHKENAAMMQDWIGAVYYWEKKGKGPESSWTWKFPILELEVNKSHPISNGLPDKFKLQDEYYFNFFTKGVNSRNPGSDKVTFLHSTMAPDSNKDIKNRSKWRKQPCYWSFEREDGGKSVAMTSAHMYHTWANPHYFKTFANSILWTLDMPIPENGAEIATPTLKDLLSVNDKVQIFTKAEHFK